jgi:hypothetical protein
MILDFNKSKVEKIRECIADKVSRKADLLFQREVINRELNNLELEIENEYRRSRLLDVS